MSCHLFEPGGGGGRGASCVHPSDRAPRNQPGMPGISLFLYLRRQDSRAGKREDVARHSGKCSATGNCTSIATRVLSRATVHMPGFDGCCHDGAEMKRAMKPGSTSPLYSDLCTIRGLLTPGLVRVPYNCQTLFIDTVRFSRPNGTYVPHTYRISMKPLIE